MLTSEQRKRLTELRDLCWPDEKLAIDAALATIDEQSAAMKRLQAEADGCFDACETAQNNCILALAESNRKMDEQAAELALLRRVAEAVLAQGLADCERFPLAREWREKYRKET